MTSLELKIFQAINLDGLDTAYWHIYLDGCGENSIFREQVSPWCVDIPCLCVWKELETFERNYPNLSKIEPDEVLAVEGYPNEEILIYYLLS